MPAPPIFIIKMFVNFISVVIVFLLIYTFYKYIFLITIAFYLYILIAIDKRLMKVNKLMPFLSVSVLILLQTSFFVLC